MPVSLEIYRQAVGKFVWTLTLILCRISKSVYPSGVKFVSKRCGLMDRHYMYLTIPSLGSFEGHTAVFRRDDQPVKSSRFGLVTASSLIWMLSLLFSVGGRH